MKIQFKLTKEQEMEMYKKYPVYFGCDSRDSIHNWVRDNIADTMYVYFDYEENSDTPFIVDVDTADNKLILNIDNINKETSNYTIIRD